MPVPPSWKASDQLNAYESWVYTAINAIAQEVASTELLLYKKKYVRGEEEYTEIKEHEALSLLDWVNPYSNYYTHLYETVIYLQLLGEAYWAVLRDPIGRPVSMWQLRPDWVTVYPSSDKLVDHYGYSIGEGGGLKKEITIPAEDVIPFRLPNPKTPYRGRSPVQSGAMAIDTDRFSADWNRNFFFNSAIPNLVFTTDAKLTEQQVKRLLVEWNAKFQGRDNAHKVAFLTGGFTPNEVGQKLKDMDFIEQRRAMRDEILGIFKVPKTVLGLTEDVNRANAEATTMAFMERTITPAIKMLVAHLNEFYLPLFKDESLFLDFKDPSPEDQTAKLALYDNGLKNGWLTRNEVRDMENLEPVEGGDSIYIPFSMTPLGTVVENVGGLVRGMFGKKSDEHNGVIVLPVKKIRKSLQKINVHIPKRSLETLRAETFKSEVKKDLINIISTAMKLKKSNKTLEGIDDKKQALKEGYWKSMIAQTDVWENTMKGKLYELFSKQEKEVLDNIKTNKSILNYGRKSIADDLLFDEMEAEEEFRKIFGAFLLNLIKTRGDDILDFIGTSNVFSTHTADAVNYLQFEGLKFVKSVNKTTIDKLDKALIDGLMSSEGIPELMKRVETVFAEAKGYRAEMIARTEVLSATNFATLEAYKQSNVVTGKEWLTAIDERTCEECDAMDGKVVTLNAVFQSPVGAVDAPPLHPNCRCTTMPVLEELKETKPMSKKNINKVSKLNDAIIDKAKVLEQLFAEIDFQRTEIDNAKKTYEQTKEEAEKESVKILEDARLQAEIEKEKLLKELKELKGKVKEIIKNG